MTTITSLAFSPQSDSIIAMLGNGSIIKFSLRSKKQTYQYVPPINMHYTFGQLFQSGQRVTMAASSGKIVIMDVPTKRYVNVLRHSKRLTAISIADKGHLLATEDERGIVTLLDVQTHHKIASTKGLVSTSAASDFSWDEDRFICASNDMMQILFWTKKAKHSFLTIDIPGVGNARIAISPNGRLLAISDEGVYAEIWKIDIGGNIKRNLYRIGTIHHDLTLGKITTSMIFSPDSNALLLGISDGSILFWQFTTGHPILFPYVFRASNSISP